MLNRSCVYTVWNITKNKYKVVGTLREAATLVGVSYATIQRGFRGGMTSFSHVSKATGDFFKVTYDFDLVCEACPTFEGTVMPQQFSSVTSCCTALGISKGVYYDRLRRQELHVPCEKEVIDVFGRPWILTFHKKDQGFKDNVNTFQVNKIASKVLDVESKIDSTIIYDEEVEEEA